MDFPKQNVKLQSGVELFHENDNETQVSLLNFWQWSMADLLNNATRGLLAEFIIATAMKIPISNIREAWSPWDLTSSEGIKIEVKSGAYIQSWYQKKLSNITFKIPETHAWNSETNHEDIISKRQADIYVFAVLKCKEQTKIDPLNLAQWEFYILSTKIMNECLGSQKSITLGSLKKYCQPIPYNSIRVSVLDGMSRIES